MKGYTIARLEGEEYVGDIIMISSVSESTETQVNIGVSDG